MKQPRLKRQPWSLHNEFILENKNATSFVLKISKYFAKKHKGQFKGSLRGLIVLIIPLKPL